MCVCMCVEREKETGPDNKQKILLSLAASVRAGNRQDNVYEFRYCTHNIFYYFVFLWTPVF